MFESTPKSDIDQFKERLSKMNEGEIRESIKNPFGVKPTNIDGDELNISFEDKENMIEEEVRSRNLF